ncbi:P1 family peptidase [Robertkochia flava]|uniref:P1 family peptidase n=1 Tax=Robertkochia flava TaxID=3447986 RepID=UPI001CC9932F|nr:P1 family peptidase [Robertkochia marina]
MKTLLLLLLLGTACFGQDKTVRDYGITIGTYKTGKLNAITDVAGVKVGHTTRREGDSIRTGVTAILPHEGNIFMQKVPAAIYVANGFGKLTGYSQVEELGEIETPIVLTNTLSVPTAADALIDYTLSIENNLAHVRSVNPVVGETNDGALNDIQGRHVTREDVLKAISNATTGAIVQGNVGAGTGTICFGYKGGIGTASRVLPEARGGYTVGVLVQTNYGGDLTIAGTPVGAILEKREALNSGDGSCMIVVATDAPLSPRNLKRLSKRAMFGLAKTGGNGSNGSGEYVIAFSTNQALRIPYFPKDNIVLEKTEVRNDKMTPLFEAVIEATEEAILNSLFAAETMVGKDGLKIESLPKEAVMKMLQN